MIYFIQRHDAAIKIGTTSHYHRRMYLLKSEHGELKLLGLMDGGRDIEKTLHQQFSDVRIGKTEWFKPIPALLSFIAQHTHLDIPSASPAFPTLRLQSKTLKMVRMYAGMLQMKTGKLVSDDDAIRHLFATYRPELIEKVSQLQEKRSDKKAE